MKLLVIDVETTSIDPREGIMVEIGIAGLDTETGKITCELNHLVKPEEQHEIPEDAWIYHNSKPPITPGAIWDHGRPWAKLKRPVEAIIGRYDKATAYNRQFDFGWLGKYGVDINHGKAAPCPMLVMTDVCKLQPVNYIGISYKWPTFEEAYLEVFGKPVDEPHRAYDDAALEAELIYGMIERGIYHV